MDEMPDKMSETKETKGGIFGPDSRAWTALFLAALVFISVYFYHGIHRPWVENDNYYGAIYAQAAHNNLRAGLFVTGFVPATLYFGPLPIPVDEYYVHHPTLLPLLTTTSFAIFGESEWSTRLVPVICSILSLIFLWVFVADTVNRRAAAFATVVLATLPMELHYGDMVDFEPCLVMLMLAALVCLRFWHTRGKWWGWLAALCCLLAVNMDWPGYLFVISVGVWHFIKGPKRNRLFALGLAALCTVSGVALLLQIRHVNPKAWSDLWTALTMRLGNGVATGSEASQIKDVHFTFGQWCHAVRHALHEDFLITPWLLAFGGAIVTVIGAKHSEKLRVAGWGALHMLVAGVLYVTILRNESYIHDFTTFYLIGSVAILAGIFLDSFFAWIVYWKVPGALAAGAMLLLFAWLGYSGHVQAESMRSEYGMLDGVTDEPQNLIPDMGKKLAATFPPDTMILCNFDPYTSVLPYYTQRTIINSLGAYDDWKAYMAQGNGPYGGIIWLDAPNAADIVNVLPKDEVTDFELDGFHFAIWKPAPKPAP